jgi:hypothetical protein
MVGGVTVSVTVPPAPRAGTVNLLATYQGTQAPPSWGETGVQYVFATRTASLTFTYFVPSPQVVSARWCKECFAASASASGSSTGASRNCLSPSGRCRNNEAPKLNHFPIDGTGVLTVVVENVPQITVADNKVDSRNSVVSVQFGGSVFGSITRVVYSDAESSAYEMRIGQAVPDGSVQASLSIQPDKSSQRSTTAVFPIKFVDSVISLRCLSGGCVAPMVGGMPFQV